MQDLGHVLVLGASGGIGQEVARQIAEKYSCRLTLGYYQQAEIAEELARQLNSYAQVQAQARYFDISQPSVLELGILESKEDFGNINQLIVCAGIAHCSLLQTMPVTEIAEVIKVNLLGSIYASKFVLPSMIAGHAGNIIFISSIWGEIGGALETVYSASKGGLITFAKALAKEVGFSGIRVNVVSPGAIDTPMLDLLTEAQKQAVIEATPRGRLGTPRDVASVVAYLLAEESSFIHGQVLSTNGGFM